VSAEFLAEVRALWIARDPFRLHTEGAEPLAFDTYDHQAYVTALCADEIHDVSDAERVLLTITRNEFGMRASILTDAAFVANIQALARDLLHVVAITPRRPATGPYPSR
jgi:hypothetical protein